MAEQKRFCVNCGHNVRKESAPFCISCYCEIDGHRIGYLESFEYRCRQWEKDHTFDEELEDK